MTRGQQTAPVEVESARQRPLVLRMAHVAPVAEIPPFAFDPVRQIATDPEGQPLGPMLKKDWTSYESTHTDGDGGDNETWGWEEQPDDPKPKK
jgi:putative ATP-grasp target RiPP